MSETRRAGNVTDSGVREQAACWFERVHAEDADIGDFLGLQIWLNASEAHAAAFRGLEELAAIACRAHGLRWATAKELSADDSDNDL